MTHARRSTTHGLLAITVTGGLALLLAACSAAGPSATSTGDPGQASVAPSQGAPGIESPADAAGAGAGGGGSLLDAALAVKNPCTMLPTELAAAAVPGASDPVEDTFAQSCTISNGTIAMQIAIRPYDTGVLAEPPGSEVIPGLGAAANLQKLTEGNFYLTVLLTPDQGAVYVEINNQDGKDHKDEVVALAQAVLAKLG
jgi:hypothetical protein